MLWLATAIVDHANRVRPNPTGLKVGGHQASSASMVTIMTALWLEQLRADGPGLGQAARLAGAARARVPARPAGRVVPDDPARSSAACRATRAGSRTRSRPTTPPARSASARPRRSGARWPAGTSTRTSAPGGTGRQWSLVGDAELDEGAVWEAVLDPMVAELGEVVWIVDLNRQSLDRVVPTMGATRLQGMFAAAGWQVLTVKYGRLLEELFARPGGGALRDRIDEMSNPEYQRLLRRDPGRAARGAARRRAGRGRRSPRSSPDVAGRRPAPPPSATSAGTTSTRCATAFAQIDDTRPTVDPRLHAQGLRAGDRGPSAEPLRAAHRGPAATSSPRARASTRRDPWAPFAGRQRRRPGCCAAAAARLRRADPAAAAGRPPVPADLGRTPHGTATTQAALGRTLLDLNRAAPEAAARVVTVSPDVSSSTNLGGWVNKVGVWSHDGAARLVRRRRRDDPALAGAAHRPAHRARHRRDQPGRRCSASSAPRGAAGASRCCRSASSTTRSSSGRWSRGRSASTPAASRSWSARRPGSRSAPEGGAHQSITTPSIGLEQPGCVTYEPAFALDTEWCLLAALGRLGRPDGSSAYLRLSTRPVDQALAAVPTDPAARERRRRQVVAGAYPLRRRAAPAVTLVGDGRAGARGARRRRPARRARAAAPTSSA